MPYPHESEPDGVAPGSAPRDGAPPHRTSPSGRTPAWALEESLNQQLREFHASQGRSNGWPPAPPHSRTLPPKAHGQRPRRRFGRGLRTGLALALVAGLYFGPGVFERHILPAALPYFPGASVPPWGVEAADAPLGQPPAVAASDAYRFHASPTDEQDFVAYDPCRPIHYVVRPDNAPPDSETLIGEAVAQVSAATGLQFIDDGITSEGPSEDRESFQPETYGKRWAPVLITWSSPEESPALAGDTAGLGGSSAVTTPGNPYVYVTGQVQLDAPALSEILTYPGGPDLVRAVIMHELGHVVGLDHVEDPNQLMNARNSNVTDFADGDRAGLARLGTGECVRRL
ncbi:matrixin family metalloprotease [uncultured Arthrobacter sp.]|uniref:matrixin family metalloprotease n=1 Tax=uncultured Arthrobacter sp. TaxID=114050 RepID=UPI0025CE0D33|nr:matrixin family metalloprotease [uncultured Arthrobacter sp.]